MPRSCLQFADRHEDELRVVFAHLAFVEIDDVNVSLDGLGRDAGVGERELHVVARQKQEAICALVVAKAGQGDAQHHAGDCSFDGSKLLDRRRWERDLVLSRTDRLDQSRRRLGHGLRGWRCRRRCRMRRPAQRDRRRIERLAGHGGWAGWHSARSGRRWCAVRRRRPCAGRFEAASFHPIAAPARRACRRHCQPASSISVRSGASGPA